MLFPRLNFSTHRCHAILRRGRQKSISPQGSGFQKWRARISAFLNEFTPSNTLAWCVAGSRRGWRRGGSGERPEWENGAPPGAWVSGLCFRVYEGYHESRGCSRDTYPESYITKYTSIRRKIVRYSHKNQTSPRATRHRHTGWHAGFRVTIPVLGLRVRA